MSFGKARDLLRLAEMASARFQGVSLTDISEEFGADHRTAQRMVRALEDVFPDLSYRTGDDRRRYWKLAAPRLAVQQGVRDVELAALEMSIRRAEREGSEVDARMLRSLRDRLLGAMPPRMARRSEADADAMLEAQGYAARPGPRVRTAPGVADVIAEALKAPSMLAIRYAGPSGEEAEDRELEPYGLLLGVRRYLVARQPSRGPEFRHFRVDRIRAARTLGRLFSREEGFVLDAYAARAFGSFQDPAQFGPVVWRFAPHAAAAAREFEFHPSQEAEEGADGSLTVRFAASGWLEMAWHLYQWGDAVEVLEPEPLRRMVEGHRRGDFEALP